MGKLVNKIKKTEGKLDKHTETLQAYFAEAEELQRFKENCQNPNHANRNQKKIDRNARHTNRKMYHVW
jgi:hypothetical protein